MQNNYSRLFTNEEQSGLKCNLTFFYIIDPFLFIRSLLDIHRDRYIILRVKIITAVTLSYVERVSMRRKYCLFHVITYGNRKFYTYRYNRT